MSLNFLPLTSTAANGFVKVVLMYVLVMRQNSTESGEGSKSKCKKEVNYEELRCLLEKDQIKLFDVREPRELEETGKIHPKAVNVPREYTFIFIRGVFLSF